MEAINNHHYDLQDHMEMVREMIKSGKLDRALSWLIDAEQYMVALRRELTKSVYNLDDITHLQEAVLSLENSEYMNGHPEWSAIVKTAKENPSHLEDHIFAMESDTYLQQSGNWERLLNIARKIYHLNTKS